MSLFMVLLSKPIIFQTSKIEQQKVTIVFLHLRPNLTIYQSEMNKLSFTEAYHAFPVILTEGAVVERLRHEFRISLDDDIIHAGLIYNDRHKDLLATIYMQYLEIAERYQLPLMLMTPTRRANQERMARSVFREKNVLADNVDFLMQLRDRSTSPVYVGGLTGCRGDAYDGGNYLSIEEAMDFHLPTVHSFGEAGVDYLFAGIMPELTECIGLAKAMETTGLPSIISFMVRRDGRLMDGTYIHDAISVIDEHTSASPLCYMANCVHPDILHQALAHPRNDTALVRARFKGIQANASNLDPGELNESGSLKSSSASELANRVLSLLWEFPLKICGGCCGTDDTHIQEISEILSFHLSETEK